MRAIVASWLLRLGVMLTGMGVLTLALWWGS